MKISKVAAIPQHTHRIIEFGRRKGKENLEGVFEYARLCCGWYVDEVAREEFVDGVSSSVSSSLEVECRRNGSFSGSALLKEPLLAMAISFSATEPRGHAISATDSASGLGGLWLHSSSPLRHLLHQEGDSSRRLAGIWLQ